jgi:hypothetical protein
MSIRTPSRERASIGALALALTLGARSAAAQTPPAPVMPPPPANFAPAVDAEKARIRERFRLGMAKYQEQAYREAIGYWDAIYREMGPREGYRVSFNLARAYEKFSDSTRAAERYEAFLAEVELRRQEGKELEPIVEKEEKEALERLAELRALKGRVRVRAGAQPMEAKIDDTERRAAGFVAYVAPGPHVVVFVRGSELVAKREVAVNAGEVIDVDPPALPAPPGERLQTRREVAHPFAPAVLYVAGAATLASVVVPVAMYASALSIKRKHDALLDAAGQTNDMATAKGYENDYLTTRTTAYATVAIPASLAAITGGLVAWYFLGKKEHELVVRPVPTQGGLGLGASGRF